MGLLDLLGFRAGNAQQESRSAQQESNAYMQRGACYGRAGDHARALAEFKQAVRVNPTDPYGYMCQGDAYRHLRDFDNAILSYFDALSCPESDIVATTIYHSRGLAYAAKGHHARARVDFERVLARNPGDIAAINELANLKRF